MRKIIGLAVFTILLVSGGQRAMAQTMKFGHMNSDELIQAMPEYDSARVKLEKFQKELVNYLELMTVELNNKSEAYNKESKNLTDLVKQTKEQELVDMNRKIQDFQTNAQTQLQQKQGELFQPVTAKLDKAVKDVGKENGFVYIFDIARGSLLYFDETRSANVTVLVKAKLGLK
jgi:outer membrane protein